MSDFDYVTQLEDAIVNMCKNLQLKDSVKDELLELVDKATNETYDQGYHDALVEQRDI